MTLKVVSIIFVIRSSLNLKIVPTPLLAFLDFYRLDLQKNRNTLTKNSAGSEPIGLPWPDERF